MKLLIYSFSLLFFVSASGFSQNWIRVGDGLDWIASCTFVDSSADLLYVGGNFKSSGSLRVRGIAKWNGAQWDSLGSGMDDYNLSYPNPTKVITHYQNKIYAGGSFSTAGGILVNGLATWDGTKWDSLPSGISTQTTVICFNEINGELNVGGTFNVVGGIISHHIAKWDGTTWYGFNFGIDSTFGGVFAIEQFNGDLYVGGNILPSAIRDLFVWDGTNVSQVGSGIHGGLANIGSMVIYNNELYVGGYFTQADGNAGNFIMKWDGNAWGDVGGGMDDQVLQLKVYNGLLYACGVFDHAGGLPASKIAVWNGLNWAPLSNDVFDNNLLAMDFYNDELYVVGGFVKINSDTFNYVAKYTGQLGMKNFTVSTSNFKLSPNPSNSIINLSLSSPLSEGAVLLVTDVIGKKQFQIFISRQAAKKEIDISELSSGIYFLTLLTENGSITKKLVKN